MSFIIDQQHSLGQHQQQKKKDFIPKRKLVLTAGSIGLGKRINGWANIESVRVSIVSTNLSSSFPCINWSKTHQKNFIYHEIYDTRLPNGVEFMFHWSGFWLRFLHQKTIHHEQHFSHCFHNCCSQKKGSFCETREKSRLKLVKTCWNTHRRQCQGKSTCSRKRSQLELCVKRDFRKCILKSRNRCRALPAERATD